MLRINQRKLDTITPYGRNPREISDAAVANVAASIAEFGDAVTMRLNTLK